MTIREVAQRIGKSEISVRRLIKSNKLMAILIDRAYQISEEALTDYLKTYQPDQATINELINQLRSEVEYLRKELSETKQRSDTIIIRLSAELTETRQALIAPPNPPNKVRRWLEKWLFK